MGDRESNLAVLRRAFVALDHRDVNALQDCFHADVVWHDLGMDNPLGSEHVGVGPVLTFLAGNFEKSRDSLQVELHDVVASDDHGVVLVRLTASLPDRSLDDRTVFVAHFRDGRISEVYAYAEDPPKVNAFWS
ncbi:MAG: nuclear transport factor 2 family protein [Actinobacteria bacterium]|nr:nuclear transport factor 2 family protein [Actinomycetota bacterium]